MRPEYAPGARNAIRTCLGISERDRVAVVMTADRREIADALEEEARGTGAGVREFVMEDWVERPAREFPRRLGEALLEFAPTASLYVGGGMPGELAFRQPLMKLLVEQIRARHGHMIGIDHVLMIDGMAGDYEEIYRTTRRVYEIARHAARIEVLTALGTELVAEFNPAWNWVPSDGRYWEQGEWGNLPEGETFTTPWRLDGLIVAEELGDHFTELYGPLPEPLRIRVRDSRVAGLEGATDELRAEFGAYLNQHPESNRAGEFAIGTNMGLTRLVGNFLQDEKFPGVHVAFGDPYGERTGAGWHCPSHCDVLASHADVIVDGRRVMEGGRLLV